MICDEGDGATLFVVGTMGVRFRTRSPASSGYPRATCHQGAVRQRERLRDSALFRASGNKQDESFIGDKQIGGAVEPGAVAFWITHLYNDAAGAKLHAVGEIEPAAGRSICAARSTSRPTTPIAEAAATSARKAAA